MSDREIENVESTSVKSEKSNSPEEISEIENPKISESSIPSPPSLSSKFRLAFISPFWILLVWGFRQS